MSEPTREQIKEAFNKTIERWEKIVEDVSYFSQSCCELCKLSPDPGPCEKKLCPVALYTESFGCNLTPYQIFTQDKTPANALAELNFLRKVYIWWMEGEKKGESVMDYMRKEEKKEGRKVGVCRAIACQFLQEDDGCSFAGYCTHKLLEEKKEEWVDVSKEIRWEHRTDGSCGFGVLKLYYKDKFLGHVIMQKAVFSIFTTGYKVEKDSIYFRILKKT
jgi:hypothetical protein